MFSLILPKPQSTTPNKILIHSDSVFKGVLIDCRAKSTTKEPSVL